ncbi:MAG: universal stress protein [Acidimicrobiales bacterium]|jgi:nucleotide-binding universal stress UspA family protein
MFGIIVVGTDGSLTADRAVARAAELAAQTGDELHIVTAHRPGPERGSAPGPSPDDSADRWTASPEAEAQATLRSAAVLARQFAVEAHTRACPGDPAKVILATARELGAGLVVIGSKGVERRILGSVPNAITHDAECDVMVVRTT